MLPRFPEGVGGEHRPPRQNDTFLKNAEISERPRERRISKERAAEVLSELNKKLADRQNERLAREFGFEKKLFDDDCAIDIGKYQPDPFTYDAVWFDRKRTLALEKIWAKVDPPTNENYRYYKEDRASFAEDRARILSELRLKDSDDPKEKKKIDAILLKHSREQQKKTPAALVEQGLTVLFGKLFGDRLIVAHSAQPDDYNVADASGAPARGGVDRVIVDTVTGEVLCTIDDVSGPVGNTRERSKKVDTNRDNSTGGKNIKYGFKIERDEAGKGKLVQTQLDHIPVFFIGFDHAKLNDLLVSFAEDPSLDSPASPTQKKLGAELVRKLLEQAENVATLPNTRNNKEFIQVQERSTKLTSVLTELLKKVSP